MKAGWEVKTLGEVCDFKGGSQPPKSEFINEPQPGYVRMLQIRDFKSDDKAVYIPITDKTNQCAETDIMIGRYGASVGQIHRGKSGAYNVALIRTIPDKKHIDQDYLYHYLTSDLFQKPLMSVSKRGAQDGFSKPDIAPFQIPLPPLEEQKRTVSILDEAFEGLDRARENAEANLKNARELFESGLDALFATTRLPQYQTSIGSFSKVFDGPHATPKTIEKGPVFLGISALVDGKLDLRKTRHVSDLDYLTWTKRVEPKARDVVFSYETRLGQAAIIPEGLKCCLGRRMGLVRLETDRVMPKFFLFQYLTPTYQKFLRSKVVEGATVDRIHLKHFPNFPMFVPPLETQQAVIKRLEEFVGYSDKVTVEQATKLQDISDLRQSLLQKAFAGELT